MDKKQNRHAAFDLKTKKSLGQHFLVDGNIIGKIASAALEVSPEKECIEIGPGAGAVTKALLERGIKVTAIEKDSRAIEGLSRTLASEFQNQFAVIETDVLKWTPSFDGKLPCVGNLPYYITSDIFLWFNRHQDKFTSGIFMIQDEVADRLVAKTGTKAYGRLSVRIQLFYDVKKLFVVSPGCFKPPPKVYSAVVRLDPKGFAFASEEEDEFFSRLTAKLFSARRKMLRRVLAEDFKEKSNNLDESALWQVMSEHGVMPETRPDAIAPSAILALHRFLWRQNNA